MGGLPLLPGCTAGAGSRLQAALPACEHSRQQPRRLGQPPGADRSCQQSTRAALRPPAARAGGRSPLALCNLRVCARPASGPSTREIIQQITPEEYWAWKQPGSNATQGEELAALGAAAANGTAGGVIPALAQLEKGGG